MDNNKKNIKKRDPDKDVIWFGLDGLLILLYVVLGSIYTYGILNRVDWIVGIFAPAVSIIICWSVFARYCVEVRQFMGQQKRK